MTLKKINKIIIILCLSMFINLNNVEATLPNGTGTNPGSGSSNGKCNFGIGKELCPWGNDVQRTVKLTVYFIYNGEFVANKGEIYWTAYESYKKSGIIEMAPYKNGSTTSRIFNNSTNWEDISKNIMNYFGLENEKYLENPSSQMEKFLNEVVGVNWKEELDGEGKIDAYDIISQEQNPTTAATYGYRIIIEPVLHYKAQNDNGSVEDVLLTVKEVADLVANQGYYNRCTVGGTNICSQAFGGFNTGNSGMASYLTVDFKDVGINPGKNTNYGDKNSDKTISCKLNNDDGTLKANFYKEISKKTNGCGYNIIDIGLCGTQHVEND